MEGFKIDPAKYAGLAQEEKVRRIAEDEHRAINESPAVVAAVRHLEQRQAQEQADKQREAVRLEELQEKRFAEALEARYQDRLQFYRLQGVPQKVFDEEIWPMQRQLFIFREEDAVDQERRELSTDVY